MKEMKIILPVKGNNAGFNTKQVRQTFEREVCLNYGGFTRTKAKGAWVNPAGVLIQEKVFVYTIACEKPSSSSGWGWLVLTAQRLLHPLGQEEIYMVGPDGEVHFITEEIPLKLLDTD